MPQAVVAVQAFIYGVVGTTAAAVGASSALAASIATAAVTVATATAKVALLAGLNAVVANQNRPRPQGGLINLTINPSEPRRLQVGKRITGGVLTDWYVTGTKNTHLFLIVYLGEGPMGRITRVYGGGRVVYSTPITHGVRTVIPNYRSGGDRLWITYYDGRPGQTADSYLIGRSVGWTSNHVGAGCAYAIIEAHWDSDNQTTPPQISFEIEGAKLYDRRKDTTAGGSGSHRANDPATWELSSNPAVALDHYLLGRYAGSIKTFGVGLDPEDVPYAEFAARANLCDENVTRKAGGTQKRYEANGFLFADRTYADTIRDLCRAMNARPADFGGRIGIIDGEEKTPVLTIYDGDVIENVPEAYNPKRSWADLVSVVRGTYQNPAQLYQAAEYPRIADAAWAEADGGSPKEATLDLEMETDPERAQRLARAFALRERRQAQLSGTYALRTIELEQGDWFIRAGGIFGTSPGKTFEVIDRVLDPRTMTVTLTAFEVDPADSAWDENLAVDPPPDPISNEDTLLAMEVPALTVTGVTLSGTSAQLPAIAVEWTAPIDLRVRQIVVEAVPEAGGVPMSQTVDVTTGEVVFTNGITDDTEYLVRARFIGEFIPSAWSTNFEVTTLGDYAVGVASSVPWSGVTGTGRPADNATVGAQAGTNLYRTDGTTVMTQPEVRTVEGTAAAIVGQGWGATASEAAASNALVPVGVNLLTDTDFYAGIRYWNGALNGGPNSTGLPQTLTVNPSGRSSQSLRTLEKSIAGTPAAHTIIGIAGTSLNTITSPDANVLRVTPGQRLEFQALVAGIGLAEVFFNVVQRRVSSDGQEEDIPGVTVSVTIASSLTVAAGGIQTSDFTLLRTFYTVPADVTVIRPSVVGRCTGEANPRITWGRIYAGQVSASQTVFSAYSPGFAGQRGSDITSQATAAAITSQGNQATANAGRGTTGARPTSTGSWNWYANTTTLTLQLDVPSSGWVDVAQLGGGLQASISPVSASGDRLGAGSITLSGFTVTVSGGVGTLDYQYTPDAGITVGGTDTAPTFTATVGVAEQIVGNVSLRIVDFGNGRTTTILIGPLTFTEVTFVP